MNPRFEIVVLEEAFDFLNGLDKKVQKKILYNIEILKYFNDPKLFKKLSTRIWELRINYSGMQFRILSFLNSEEGKEMEVVLTHGSIKKLAGFQ